MAKLKSVRLSRRAIKVLEGIDTRFKEPLKETIHEISQNPMVGKKLKGDLEGLRSYRLGSFRIVYRFSKTLVEVVYLDHRKDMYR